VRAFQMISITNPDRGRGTVRGSAVHSRADDLDLPGLEGAPAQRAGPLPHQHTLAAALAALVAVGDEERAPPARQPVPQETTTEWTTVAEHSGNPKRSTLEFAAARGLPALSGRVPDPPRSMEDGRSYSDAPAQASRPARQ
jgi:hypothetical protein